MRMAPHQVLGLVCRFTAMDSEVGSSDTLGGVVQDTTTTSTASDGGMVRPKTLSLSLY